MSKRDEIRAIFMEPKPGEKRWYQAILSIHGSYFPLPMDEIFAASGLDAADELAKMIRQTGLIDDHEPLTPVICSDQCYLCIGRPDKKGVYKAIVSIALMLGTEEACRRIAELVPEFR